MLAKWARDLRQCPISPFSRPDVMAQRREIEQRITNDLDESIRIIQEYSIESEWIPFVLAPFKERFVAQLKWRMETSSLQQTFSTLISVEPSLSAHGVCFSVSRSTVTILDDLPRILRELWAADATGLAVDKLMRQGRERLV